MKLANLNHSRITQMERVTGSVKKEDKSSVSVKVDDSVESEARETSARGKAQETTSS